MKAHKVFVITYYGKRFFEQAVRHKLFYSLFGLNALFYIATSVFNPYIGAYYLEQGISLANIGILTAIGPFITLLAQPVWGYLGDRTGRHMFALRMALTGGMLAVLVFYLAGGVVGFALSAAVFALFNCGIQPLNDTITVRLVSERGYRFSAIRMGGTIGYALSVILVGGVLRENASAFFGITSVVYLCMLALTFTVPSGPRTVGKRRKLDVKSLFQNRKIMFVILIVFVFQVATGFHNSFLGVFVTELGYDKSVIGILMCIAAVVEIPVLLCIEWALRRFRAEALMIFAGFSMAVRIAIPPFVTSLEGLIIVQCFGGITYMVMYYSTVIFFNNNLAPELRGTGMAVLCVVQSGFASLFSNIVGGQLGQFFGLRKTYLIYAIILFVFNVFCAAWVMYRNRRQKTNAA